MTRAKKLLFMYQQQQPLDYTEVSYLQSNGFQSINTGINGKSTLKIEIKWRVLSITGRAYIFGSTGASNTGRFCSQRNATSLDSQYDGVNTTISNSLTIDTDYTLIKDGNLVYLNDVLVFTDAATTFDNGFPIYLFARNSAGAIGLNDTTRLYSCKMWDSGVLVRDYIPVLKDGKYCLYDKVSQTYNNGVGSFTGG